MSLIGLSDRVRPSVRSFSSKEGRREEERELIARLRRSDR